MPGGLEESIRRTSSGLEDKKIGKPDLNDVRGRILTRDVYACLRQTSSASS